MQNYHNCSPVSAVTLLLAMCTAPFKHIGAFVLTCGCAAVLPALRVFDMQVKLLALRSDANSMARDSRKHTAGASLVA